MVEEGSNSSSGGPSLSPLDDTPSRGPRSNPQVNGKEDNRSSPRQVGNQKVNGWGGGVEWVTVYIKIV